MGPDVTLKVAVSGGSVMAEGAFEGLFFQMDYPNMGHQVLQQHTLQRRELLQSPTATERSSVNM